MRCELPGDEIDADVGDEAENLNIGRRNRQQNQRVDPSQQNTQSVDNRSYGANAIDRELSRLSADVGRHSQQILELIIKMDDLPARVRDLEKTEVVIRPRPNDVPEIVIRPAAQLSTRTLMIVLVGSLAIVIALVAFLVYWQVTHGS